VAGRLCRAKSSRTGKPCKKHPIRGAVVCRTHGGAAPQVKRAAAWREWKALMAIADPDRVLAEVACVGFSNVQDLYGPNGKLLPISQWPEEAARAVKSIEVVKANLDKGDGKLDDVVKITLWDKPKKLENAMRHHGQLIDKLEVSSDAELLSRLDAWKQRNAKAKR
jgi:terminase small subunit-like protein